MTWGQDFAEGDSGVVMTPAIAIWNKIESDKINLAKVEWVEVPAIELYGQIIGIARSIATNENTHNSDRIAALDVMRQAMLDCSSITPNPPQDA